MTIFLLLGVGIGIFVRASPVPTLEDTRDPTTTTVSAVSDQHSPTVNPNDLHQFPGHSVLTTDSSDPQLFSPNPLSSDAMIPAASQSNWYPKEADPINLDRQYPDGSGHPRSSTESPQYGSGKWELDPEEVDDKGKDRLTFNQAKRLYGCDLHKLYEEHKEGNPWVVCLRSKVVSVTLRENESWFFGEEKIDAPFATLSHDTLVIRLSREGLSWFHRISALDNAGNAKIIKWQEKIEQPKLNLINADSMIGGAEGIEILRAETPEERLSKKPWLALREGPWVSLRNRDDGGTWTKWELCRQGGKFGDGQVRKVRNGAFMIVNLRPELNDEREEREAMLSSVNGWNISKLLSKKRKGPGAEVPQ